MKKGGAPGYRGALLDGWGRVGVYCEELPVDAEVGSRRYGRWM